MLLNDLQIRELAEAGMITPFVPEKIRKVDDIAAISFGASSYGYDLRLASDQFKSFRHIPGTVINPKWFNPKNLEDDPLHTDEDGSFFIARHHSYSLAYVYDYLKIPEDITVLFIGKSTYARCGIIVNTTPAEAGWEGHLTLEISNSADADVRIYAMEGICQALFFRGEPCLKPYGQGKYQNQAAGVTLARV
jgi:dCTP deaminase